MKKNVLLVSFDDLLAYWRYRDVFGEPLQVPNLDRLCARATVFRNAYAQAPICGPSRASFMSGLSPATTGIFDNRTSIFDRVPDRALWPFRLKEAGYFNSSGGKVHHGYGALRRRHHKTLYHDNQKRFDPDMHFPQGVEKQKFGGHRGGWAATDPADDHRFYDHEVSTSAATFLSGFDAAQPFYREVGFYSPHGPFYTPVRFRELYDPDRFQRPESWDRDGFPDEPFIRDRVPSNPQLEAGNTEWWRQSLRNYFSAVSHGDYHLGRVLDALEASPHAGSTLVVVLSDHGYHLGDRNRFSKFTLFEQSLAVPLIVFDPADPTPRTVDDPVALLDVGPTIMDYAGLSPIEGCDGRSLLPYLRGAGDPDRAITSFSNDGATVRQGRHRLIRYHDGNVQLFDVESDLWQQHDLGRDDPAFAPLDAELRRVCRAQGFEIGAMDGTG